MAAKLLVLLLASSLLGAAPQCRCEEVAPPLPQKQACGQCPEDPAPQPGGCPQSDCRCEHEGTDRVTEPANGILPAASPLDLELDASVPGIRPAERASKAGEVVLTPSRQASVPLYILFRHFSI